MKDLKELRLSEKFMSQYRSGILLRILGTAVLVGIAAALTAVIDFSASRYPIAGVLSVYAASLVLAELLFKIRLILFCPTRVGEITKIEVKNIREAKGNRGRPVMRLVVLLTVEYGENKSYTVKLFRADFEGKNLFYTLAPYKEGDTVVHLRGLAYPMRYGIKDAENLVSPQLVCPWCGGINSYENDRCEKCGKYLEK